MKLAVYTDYVYRRTEGTVYAERAFALFLAALAPHVERLRLIGRLAPDGGRARYALPPEVELAPLPHYATLADPAAALGSLGRSFRRVWHALDDIDVVWVLGPYPHAIALVAVALCRRRSVVLGVRQDWPRYVRRRRPGRRWMHWSADVLEWIWRALARRLPVVAVGPELSAHYAHAPAVLELVVSLVPAAELERPAATRDYGGELSILSVGRLDEEKNPLLLADVLALLRRRRPALAPAGVRRGRSRRRAVEPAGRARPRRVARSCSATSRSARSCSSSTARATRSCTCPGPRASRRCWSRRSAPLCRSSPPTSAACATASTEPRC